jgi:hypothetical protein
MLRATAGLGDEALAAKNICEMYIFYWHLCNPGAFQHLTFAWPFLGTKSIQDYKNGLEAFSI